MEKNCICRALLLLPVICGIAMAQQTADSPAKKCAQPQVVVDAKYSPGQVWSYHTRKGEESSTITVLRVESLPKVGVIVHVRVDGIRLKNCSGGPSPMSIGHSPISKDALDRSVTTMLKQGLAVPDYMEGYKNWREACGGVYTITLGKILDADEAAFNSGKSCSSH